MIQGMPPWDWQSWTTENKNQTDLNEKYIFSFQIHKQFKGIYWARWISSLSKISIFGVSSWKAKIPLKRLLKVWLHHLIQTHTCFHGAITNGQMFDNSKVKGYYYDK